MPSTTYNPYFPNLTSTDGVTTGNDKGRNSFSSTDKSFIRLAILKNSPNGKLEFLYQKDIRKGSPDLYSQNFIMVKGNFIHILTYLLEEKGPALYMITGTGKSEMTKVKIPGNSFLLLQEARIVNDDTCLVPYFELQTQTYGLAKIVF